MTSENVDVSRTILVKGIPFDQLVEHNGRTPSAGEERKQKKELDKLKQESPAVRAERLRKQEEETASIVREVPWPSTSSWPVKKQSTAGQPIVLQATPHPGYHAQGKYGSMFSQGLG